MSTVAGCICAKVFLHYTAELFEICDSTRILFNGDKPGRQILLFKNSCVRRLPVSFDVQSIPDIFTGFVSNVCTPRVDLK